MQRLCGRPLRDLARVAQRPPVLRLKLLNIHRRRAQERLVLCLPPRAGEGGRGGGGGAGAHARPRPQAAPLPGSPAPGSRCLIP